jgi:glutaredoxin
MKKQIIAFLLIIISFLGVLYLVYYQTNQSPTSGEALGIKLEKKALIYFYGDTCPHCKELSAWIDENKIEEKVKLQKKEVYNNRTNANLLNQAAELCNLDTNSIGVPFIYDNGKCYVGTPEAQELLRKKAKI